jgi:hypothetical protein
MTNSLDPHHPREYRRRGAPIAAFGLTGVILGTTGVIDPGLLGSSSVGQQLDGPLDELWLAIYALAGLACFIGVVFLRPALEVVGLTFLLAAVLINGMAVFVNRGLVAGGVTTSSLFFTAWVLWWRIGDLRRAANANRRLMVTPIDFPDRRSDD